MRKRNPDGTVNVHCFKCGHFICRQQYVGYSTALCDYCATDKPRPIAADPQEELLMALYASDTENSVENRAKHPSKWSPMDLLVNTFRAIGFGRKKEAEIPTEKVQYDGIEKATSVQIAKRKKRQPIFGTKKEEKDGNG